jgi:hypothetical protein
MPLTLYHVTELDALPGILIHGLQPRLGPRSTEAGEPRPAVFCFTSWEACEQGLSGWLGEAFENSGSLCILELETPRDHPMESSTAVAYEVTLLEPLSPKHIRRVLDEDGRPFGNT